MVHTKWFLGHENLTDAYMIRTSVFIEEQQVPKELEMDENDQKAIHLVVYDNDQPVATGRLIIEGDKCFIGRVATMKNSRGKGFGDFLMRMLIRKAFDKGYAEQHIHAQISAKKFYEKLGFVAYGDMYDDAGIPHVSMVHKGDVFGHCHCV